MNPPARAASSPRTRAFALLLAAATIVAFGRVVTHEFTIWDDPHTIAQNPSFRPPTVAGVLDYWRLFEPPTAETGQVVHHAYGLWVPLTYTVWGALAAIAQVRDPSAAGGVELNPYVFHAANVALHAGSALLAFHLLRRLTGNDERAAVVGAALFALHPVQVEAVAWASGTKDVLAGMLGLAALLLYVRHADARPTRRRRLDWWLATLCFAAALLAKPSAVSVPLLAAAIDLLLLRRPWRATALAVTPWLAIAAVAAVIAKLAQPGTGLTNTDLWLRPLVAADAVAFYLGKVVFPAGLTVDYGRTPAAVVASGAVWWTWLIPAAAAIAAAAAWQFRGVRMPGAALAVFVLAPLPVLGFTPFLFQFYSTTADHYLYVAMLGPGILAAWLVRNGGRGLLFTAAVFIAILAGMTVRQGGFWRDSEALFTRAVQVNPNSFAGHNNLGTLASMQGRVEDAERRFRRAVELQPRGLQAIKNLREILTVQGRPREAMEALRQETRLRQSLPYLAAGPYWNDPSHLGVLLLLEGRYDAAERHFTLLARLEPGNAQAHVLLRLARMLMETQSTRPATMPG